MRCLGVLIIAVLAVALVGCESSQQVIDPLPAPFYPEQRPVRPPEPPRLPEPPPTPPRPTVSLSGATIVIDPGHGGGKPGAWPRATSKLPEKTIVLDIANRLVRELRARGARVIPTRTTDVDVDFDDRARIAEENRADLFVSIHADSAPRRSASGTGVHVYLKASAESEQAARCIIAAFENAGIECRGRFQNNFAVLRDHSRPAVLIECGFLTNPGDARLLNTPEHRAALAATIAAGIAEYFTR